MIKYNDILIITLVIDLILLYIYCSSKLNKFDKYNIVIILFIHFIFCISILNKYDLMIDIGHILFIINIYILSLFITNTKLLVLYVFIIFTMLCYWKIDNKCPMGEYQNIRVANKFLLKYRKEISIIPYIVLSILFYKIYKNLIK